VHRRRVADDVLESEAVAHLGAELRVLFEQLFLLPHDHPVDLDRLREERSDDVHENVVAAKLLVADVRLVDRQRAGRAVLDLDRHADVADRFVALVRRDSAGAIEKIRFVPQIRDDARPAGRDDVAVDPFAQRILAASDLFVSQPDCRLRAQSAGGIVE
jgi:hypothetical protein